MTHKLRFRFGQIGPQLKPNIVRRWSQGIPGTLEESSLRQLRGSQPQTSAGVTVVPPGIVRLHPAELAGTNALVMGEAWSHDEPGSTMPTESESRLVQT